MARYTVTVNSVAHNIDADPDTPLLWVLRDELALTGTKFGCGIGACGACTVWLGGTTARSCVVPISAVGSKPVATIEGLSATPLGRRLQRAWVRHQVPQCGYCQSGQLMAAAALLTHIKSPADRDIDDAMSNICRCGTYQRIRAAIHDVARDDVAGASTSSGT